MAVIVTADDDPDIREAIARILQKAGHTVYTVTDGAAALTQARTVQPDLVLLDGQMPPGMNGFDACQALRDDADLTDIPVVMVTGSMPPDQVRQHAPHARDVVSKPFTHSDLQTCVQRVLSDAASD